MKKLLALVLLMGYGLSSIGMTVHLHYCCGKLDKIQFSAPSKKHCGNKHEHISGKSCCDDKEISIKLKSDYNSEKQLIAPLHIAANKTAHLELSASLPLLSKKLLPEIFAPPPLQKDIPALYCIYRI